MPGGGDGSITAGEEEGLKREFSLWAIFALAFATSLVYLFEDNRLKAKRPSGLRRLFPSLERLDELLRDTVPERAAETIVVCPSITFPVTELRKIIGIGLVGLTQYLVWSLVAMNLSLPAIANLIREVAAKA